MTSVVINHESGSLGVSETSFDLRDLWARKADDVRAAEAVAQFCYKVKSGSGVFAAAFGGLGTLLFAGGIGDNALVIRARIYADHSFFGIQLDSTRNKINEPVIAPMPAASIYASCLQTKR